MGSSVPHQPLLPSLFATTAGRTSVANTDIYYQPALSTLGLLFQVSGFGETGPTTLLFEININICAFIKQCLGSLVIPSLVLTIISYILFKSPTQNQSIFPMHLQSEG